MSFEEFIKYVEEHYQKKFNEIKQKRDELYKEYDTVKLKKEKLKPPIFTKKHPFFYAVGGVAIALSVYVLTFMLSKVFPFISNGITSIIVSIISTFSVCAGYNIYVQSKDEAGKDSNKYLNYQEELNELKKKMNNLSNQCKRCTLHLEDAQSMLISKDDIKLAKECYLYLIKSKDKEKKIDINEQLLDELLLSTSLPVILYKYYGGELDKYSGLSGRERYIEGKNLDLSGKIELVKKAVEQEFRNLEKKKQMEEATLKEQSELQIPYQRRRRVERNKDNYGKEFPLIEEEEKGHHR